MLELGDKADGKAPTLFKKKSNLHYTCDITPKRVTLTSGEAHLRCLILGNIAPKRCRAVGDTVSDLTNPGIEPQTSSVDIFNHVDKQIIFTISTSTALYVPPKSHFTENEYCSIRSFVADANRFLDQSESLHFGFKELMG